MFEYFKRNIIWVTVFVIILNLIFCLLNGITIKYLEGLIMASLTAGLNCLINYKIAQKKYVENSTLFVIYGTLLISIIYMCYIIITKNVKANPDYYICFSPVFVIHFIVYKKLDIKKE